MREAAIAEVEPEKIGKCLLGDLSDMFAAVTAVQGCLPSGKYDIDARRNPSAKCPPRYPGPTGGFRLRQPTGEELRHLLHLGRRSGHVTIIIERTFDGQSQKKVEPRGRFPSFGPRADFQVAPLGLRGSL